MTAHVHGLPTSKGSLDTTGENPILKVKPNGKARTSTPFQLKLLGLGFREHLPKECVA